MVRRAPSPPRAVCWLIALLPFLAGSLAVAPDALSAQAQTPVPEAPESKHYWASVGAGGSGDNYMGFGASLAYAPAPGRILSLRAIYLEEFLPCIFSSCTPGSRFDAGILAGVSDDSRWTSFSAAAGLGVAGNQEPGESQRAPPERSWSPAIPFEARALLTPLHFVGIGAYGFGNISLGEPMAGLFLIVQIGNLPGKRP